MNAIYGLALLLGACIGYAARLVNEIHLASNGDFFIFLEALNRVFS